jgi:hypothetical protein
MREEPFEQSARAGAGNDNVPQRTGDVRCRPVANSKGYTYRPRILPADLERRKLLVTKLMLQFRKQRK